MMHNMTAEKAEMEKDLAGLLQKGAWTEEEVEMMHYLATILHYLEWMQDKYKAAQPVVGSVHPHAY